MKTLPILLSFLLGSVTPAMAQLSINFGAPGVSIGINLPVYPQLERVPGYPVYYAPGVNSNYFFYDGLYWVLEGDNWYTSSWYNGPWTLVDSMDVPVYLLRVPVRYYRHAPSYFQGWRADDSPRWGDHWGQSWVQRRSGWDQWDRKSAPAPAPLPTYQRQYTGSRYPQPSQQAVIQTRSYTYQPRDPVAQQHFQRSAQVQQAQPQQAPQPQRQSQQAPKPQQAERQPQPAPAVREQKPQPQQAQRQPQPAPAVREQKPQPQQAPIAREQRAQPQQASAQKPQAQPANPARELQPSPQQAERKPQQGPAAREVQAARPQAQERAPQGKEQAHEKDGKEKAQEKGQGG